MRRILLFLLAGLLLLGGTSCGEEKYKLLYSTTDSGLTFCVRGSGKRLRQVVVKRGDAFVYGESVTVETSVGEQNGTYGLEVADLNFDGVPDFLLTVSVTGECKKQTAWVYSASKDTYLVSPELTGKCNLQADANLQNVFTFAHTYQTEQAYSDVPASHIKTDTVTQWEVVGEGFQPTKYVSLTYYSETDRYCYSVAFYDGEAGKFDASDDYWFTPEEYKNEDFSYLYYFR